MRSAQLHSSGRRSNTRIRMRVPFARRAVVESLGAPVLAARLGVYGALGVRVPGVDIIPIITGFGTRSCATLAISCATPWAAQDLVTTSCVPHPVPGTGYGCQILCTRLGV